MESLVGKLQWQTVVVIFIEEICKEFTLLSRIKLKRECIFGDHSLLNNLFPQKNLLKKKYTEIMTFSTKKVKKTRHISLLFKGK